MGIATSKSLKLKDVSFITCADDGAVFLNGSTREKSSWGLRRLDLATQQVSDIGDTVTRCEGPYAVLGDTVVGVELESHGKVKTIVTLDRNTGEVRARYGEKFERNVIAVAASAGFIGALTADWDTQQSSLEVFDANSGKSVLKVDTAAFAFSESGDAVVYVIAAQALVHQPLGKGKATKVPFDEKFMTGLMARQGSRLLST